MFPTDGVEVWSSKKAEREEKSRREESEKDLRASRARVAKLGSACPRTRTQRSGPVGKEALTKELCLCGAGYVYKKLPACPRSDFDCDRSLAREPRALAIVLYVG